MSCSSPIDKLHFKAIQNFLLLFTSLLRNTLNRSLSRYDFLRCFLISSKSLITHKNTPEWSSETPKPWPVIFVLDDLLDSRFETQNIWLLWWFQELCNILFCFFLIKFISFVVTLYQSVNFNLLHNGFYHVGFLFLEISHTCTTSKLQIAG